MPDETQPELQLDDKALFQGAVAGEDTQPAPAEPEPLPVPAPEPTPEPSPAAEATIPPWRLREEAEARRLAEDRARTLEARLTEITTHLQQQAQGAKQPDFFENPDAATQALIMRTLQPYAQEIRETQQALGRMIAEVRHTPEKLSEAESAFLEAMNSRALDPVDYERVVQSPNRYDAVVQWHKRQAVLSSVGDDPNAWFEKQLEAKMADPQFQSKLLEKVRVGAAARPATTQLPPSLSKTTAVAGNGPDRLSMSDADLFRFAMNKS